MVINNFLSLVIITMSGSEEEVKKMDEVIDEQTAKAAEEVSNKIENLVEKVGVDATLVEPVIEMVTSAAATVVSEGAKVVAEKLGLKMISETSLSEDQKKLATSIYESIKPAVQGFISDPDVNGTIKITKVLGQVIKQLENTKIDGKIITGADKKAVAIQLGRILIKEVTPDDKGEAEILMVYDMVAEATLEAMIEVSKVVNVAVQEMATKCLPGFFKLFKRVKASK
jgi:hypothetical protein